VLPATTIRDRPRPRATPWPLERLLPPTLELLGRLAVPAAVLAAGWSLARFAATGGAEAMYLTRLATLVLCSVAFLTPRPGLDLGLGSTLAVLSIWVLPPGPTRGAGVTLLLLALMAIAAMRRWTGMLAEPEPSELPLAGPTLESPAGRRLAKLWGAAFWTLAGLQALLGAGDLLGSGFDLETTVRYLVLPAVAASSVVLLAWLRGLPQALLAAALVGALGGGWGPGPTFVLLALAGGALFAASASRGRAQHGWAQHGRAQHGPAAHGWARDGWTRIAIRGLAGAAVLAPLLWQQRAGAVAVAGGLALALATVPGRRERARSRRSDGRRSVLLLLPGTAVLAGAAALPLHAWDSALSTALWLPVLVPVVLFILWADVALGLVALGLALAAALGAPGVSALAAPAALAILALPRLPSHGASAGAPDPPSAIFRLGQIGIVLQGAWSAVLLAGTVAAATYPWLRESPLEVAAGLVGAAPTGLAALTSVVLASSLSLLLAGATRPKTPLHCLCLAPLAVLACLLAVHLPSAPLAAAHPGGRVLDAESPELSLEISNDPTRSVVVDTHLTHAHDLAAGTLVGLVRLESPSGAVIEQPLRMGLDTGEWAAARPDLALRPDLATPAPWLSQVVSTADGVPFFAHRYRAVLDLEGSRGADRRTLSESRYRVTVRRAPDLPPKVTLAVFQLEVRP